MYSSFYQQVIFQISFYVRTDAEATSVISWVPVHVQLNTWNR